MALVLTLKAGEDFYVGDERVTVADITSLNEFILLRHKDLVSFTVVNGPSIELFPGVKVSAGLRGQSDLARVAIEAPRSVRILRTEHYIREQTWPKP